MAQPSPDTEWSPRFGDAESELEYISDVFEGVSICIVRDEIQACVLWRIETAKLVLRFGNG